MNFWESQSDPVAHSKVLNEWGGRFEKREAFKTALGIWIHSCTLFEFPMDFLIKFQCIQPEVFVTREGV
jgi:hypothetical protein